MKVDSLSNDVVFERWQGIASLPNRWPDSFCCPFSLFFSQMFFVLSAPRKLKVYFIPNTAALTYLSLVFVLGCGVCCRNNRYLIVIENIDLGFLCSSETPGSELRNALYSVSDCA